MMHSPLISIVLPTYNGKRYLGASIESCMRQTYDNWELIIVDDASTDDTPSCIAEYVARDQRISAVRHPTNRKLPGALNTGFARAWGRFLTWTSDDNCYRPEALAEMLAFLHTNSSVDVVYADFTVIDDEGSPIRAASAGLLEELPFDNVIGPCFLYRRAVHERLGGYAPDLFLVEDYDFWLRASASFRLARLPKDLYLYRLHENSLTVVQSQKIRLAVERCLARNLPRMAWMDRELRARAYRNLVDMAMRRRDRRAARSSVLKWVRSDPLILIRRDVAWVAYALLPPRLGRLIRWPEALDCLHRMDLASREIEALIAPGGRFILVDENLWGGGGGSAGRDAIPFLERDGRYWGNPPDDATAIRELERLRRSGAAFLVFAWPAFWWLDYYSGLHGHLRSEFPCVLKNDRLVVFDLRPPAQAAKTGA